MASAPAIVGAGILIGALLGLFGVGGSSIATPILSLLGVPPLVAVASPLVATIPGAFAAAWPYVKADEARPRAAAWTAAGGIPGTILGALLSPEVGGTKLLIASGVVLVLVGWRALRPLPEQAVDRGTLRRQNRPLLVAAAFAVGIFTGVLANGGAFILVPLYLLVFGLQMRQAVGTSLLVVLVLSIPTLATHLALGHVQWSVAIPLAVGMVPAGAVSSRFAHGITHQTLQRAFGWFLIGFGSLFTLYRLTLA